MASNPFLDSVTARDNYISSTTDPDYSPSQDKTSSGNPFLDSINHSSNSRLKTKKQLEDEEKKRKLDELAKQEASAQKPKSLIDMGADLVNGAATAIAAPFKRTGEGVAEVLGEVTGQNQQIRDNQSQQIQQQIEQIRLAGQKIKDPNISPEEKERWKKVLSDNARDDNPFTQAQDYNNQQIEKTDPVKGAAAVGELGLNVLTGGVNGIRAGAAVGGAFGALGNIEDKGSKAGVADTLTSAATGAALGGAIPLIGKAAKGLASKIGSRGQEVAQKAAVESQQAAEDLAARNKAGIPELSQDASQSVKTSPNEVIQVVNPSTGEKTFYRIPADKRDELVNGIDNARDGSATAGKQVDGAVTHVTARTPEDMASKGFTDGGIYGENAPQVGQAVKNVATPEGETAAVPGTAPSRYSSKTLKNSEFVGLNDDKLSAEYQQTTNATRADQSLKQLDAEGVDDFGTKVSGRLDGKHITDQTVFDAQAAAQALEEKGGTGNLAKAAEIYNKLSEHLSKAGQTVQAASIMARRTPQGLRYYAQKQFEKAGVEFTPELQKELQGLIKEVKNAKPQTDEAAIARDNVMYFIGKNLPSSFGDKVTGFWRAGLLTAPTTPAGAVAGNAAMTVQRKLVTNPVATFADLVQSAFTGKRTQTFAKAGEFEKGAIEGAKNATSGQYWKTGRDAMTANKQGKYDTPNTGINYGKSQLGQLTGKYVNGVYQLMGALDQPFRYGAQRESLSSLAQAEIKNQKLTGEKAKTFYDEFMANPPKAAAETAQKEALRETFQDETKLGNAASSLTNSLGTVGKVLVPFTKVPASVATRIIDHTPIGTARTLIKEVVNATKGKGYDQRAVSRAFGEGTLAVPILGIGYALAQNGEVTGGYPSTKEARDQWQAEGKQPNSVRVGDKWYSLNYIQPFGTLLSIGAGISEAQKSGADTGQIVAEALASGGKSFINQSFLQGISQGLDAVDDPAQFAGKYVANLASSIIPNGIRAGVRAADPYQRETEGIEAGILSGIPGGRDQLPLKLDADGNPIEAKAGFIDQYANPLKPSNVRDDTNAEFYNNAVSPATTLKARRTSEINDLLGRGSVQAAQRKVNEYNEQVAKILSPYIDKNRDNIDDDQLDRIRKLFLDDITVNKKGRPVIGSSPELPK